MRFLLHLAAAALLVALGIGGMTAAAAADRDARAAMMGRQQIREELSAALAKGNLTRMDQYRLLIHAKGVLSDDDFHGFEQTLDRIAAQQAKTPATTTAHSVAAVERAAGDSESEMVTPSMYEQPTPGETPSAEEIPSPLGKPLMDPEGEVPQGKWYNSEEIRAPFRWLNLDLFSSVDGFKGPIDIGDANGNFGLRFGINAGVPVLPRLGVGLQAGASAVLSNLKGTPYPEPDATIRDQIFTTVGMFQRIYREDGVFTWGFAYDWLFDDYYSNFNFGQWRVRTTWEYNPWNELGIQVSVPDHGDTGYLPDFFGNIDELHFKPIAQGYLSWKHTWSNDASLTGRFGVAERPGEFVFGGAGRVPLTKNLAMTGDFSYIMPNAAGGAIAQTQEIWNVSVGLEFVLGGFGHGSTARFRPFLPVADNGSMAVRELGD